MQWQPIETAPRDGTPILTVHPPFQCEVSHFEGNHLVRLNADMTTTPISGTHWMPLPEPPSKQ